MTLEERIKALLEGTITVSGDNLSVSHDESDADGDGKPDDEEDQDTGKDGDTDVTDDEGDDGKKNQFGVKEETSVPGLGKSLSGEGASEAGAGKTAKIKAGLGKGDSKTMPKLSADDSADGGEGGKGEEGGAGKTAKIKAGLSKGDKATPAKMNMKEHMDAMFQGQELSEEFKSNAQTIFEAAVEFVAAQKAEELAEETTQQIAEAVEAIEAKLGEQVDAYLDYVVESWIEENQVALESGIRVEMVDSFIDGMKRVFTEHYVNVPEDKVEVVEEQAQEIEELTAKLAEATEIAQAAATKATILECESIMESKSVQLNAIDREKFEGLCEGVDFDTVEDFAAKAQTIMETYFGAKAVAIPSAMTEGTEQTEQTSATMSKYVDALTRQADFTRS